MMIRGERRPPRRAARGLREELAGGILAGSFTAAEMLRRYCTLVFARTGNYQETARRLGIDRRTVKEKVDPALPEQPSRARTRRPGHQSRLNITILVISLLVP